MPELCPFGTQDRSCSSEISDRELSVVTKKVQTKDDDLTKKSKNLASLGPKNISSKTDPKTSVPVTPISLKNIGVSNLTESGSPGSIEIKGHQAPQIQPVHKSYYFGGGRTISFDFYPT